MGKGKKGKKSKGKGKKGKGSDSTHDGGLTLDHFPAGKGDVLMLALLAEGRKQSVGFYHQSYMEQKEVVRSLRLKLHKVEHEQFDFMRKLIDTSDGLAFKLLDMKKYREDFLALLDVDHDSTIMSQRNEIIDLFKRIEEIEQQIETVSQKHHDMLEFQLMGGEVLLEEELKTLEQEAEAAKDRHRNYLIRIQNRHEQSLFFTSQRVQRIMKDMEAVASKKQFDRLPKDVVDKMIRNRLLTHQVEETRRDSEFLENQIRKLEEINMDHITQGLEVDWNLMYGIDEYSEGDDYVFDLNPTEDDEWSFSDLESLKDDIEDDEDLWNAVKPQPQKSVFHKRIENVEECVQKVIELEVSKRRKEAEARGVLGNLLPLKKPNLVTAGGIKYYDSNIVNC